MNKPIEKHPGGYFRDMAGAIMKADDTPGEVWIYIGDEQALMCFASNLIKTNSQLEFQLRQMLIS
jgi:hypothetical protein